MSRAVIYCRVSTDEQHLSGAGLNAQLDACADWIKRKGFDLAGPYVEEEGISGSTPIEKRTKLMDAIQDLRKGDVLLVAKRDRLARGEPILVATIEALVARKKARVLSAAGEGTDGEKAEDILMRRMIDAFAEFERLIIKARTKAGLAAKKARNERTGRVPYGMDLVDDGRRSRKSDLPNGLQPSAYEQIVLRKIRDLRATGWTYDRIARYLNVTSIPTKAGKPWLRGSVRYICVAHHFEKATSDAAPSPAGPQPVPAS